MAVASNCTHRNLAIADPNVPLPSLSFIPDHPPFPASAPGWPSWLNQSLTLVIGQPFHCVHPVHPVAQGTDLPLLPAQLLFQLAYLSALPSGLRVPLRSGTPPLLPFDIVLLFLQDMADMGQLRPVQLTDAVLPVSRATSRCSSSSVSPSSFDLANPHRVLMVYLYPVPIGFPSSWQAEHFPPGWPAPAFL